MRIDGGSGPDHSLLAALRKMEAPERPRTPTMPASLSGQPGSAASPDAPVATVEFNIFIPMESVNVEDVVGIPLPGGLDGIHQGDGREIGEEGTSRVANTINVYPNPDGDPPFIATADTVIGESHELDGDGNVIESATAPADSVRAEVIETREDGTIVVEFSGETSNPVQVAAPGITYNMTIEMRPNGDGSWAVVAQGEHDGFPAYEILASAGESQQEIVYSYDPRDIGADPRSLFGGFFQERVSVEADARVEATPRAPEEVVAAYTNENGVVDADALGADLTDMALGQADVDREFIAQVMEAVPQEQREAVANAFFADLEASHSLYEYGHVGLASTPNGAGIILEMGTYAPAHLSNGYLTQSFARGNYEAVQSGDPEACALASEWLERISDDPGPQGLFAILLMPVGSGDEEAMQATPEGKALFAQLERIL